MLNCQKLVADADALLAGELDWRRRLSIKAHLVICHHCRRYLRQLRWLLRAVPTMHRRATDEEVERIMVYVREHSG